MGKEKIYLEMLPQLSRYRNCPDSPEPWTELNPSLALGPLTAVTHTTYLTGSARPKPRPAWADLRGLEIGLLYIKS